MESVSTLVSVDEAKRHLRTSNPTADFEEDIQSKLDQATLIILNYINTTAYWRTISAAWTESTVPGAVHAAILLQLAFLYRFRGDVALKEASERDDGLAPGVSGLLRRYRDPAVA